MRSIKQLSTTGFLLSLIALIGTKQLMAQRYIGKLESNSPEFERLVDLNSKIEVLASGFTWTEGPVWLGNNDGHLLFSDIPRNSIFKWKPDGDVSLFMSPSGYTGVSYYGLEPGSNGLLLDQAGRLVMCEHGDRRLSILTPGGGKLTLADRYKGQRLNSPNDAALRRNGDIYFTDPPYGLPERFDDPMRELQFCGVYRVTPEGEVDLLTDSIPRPNGIAFSPDQTKLYIAQSNPTEANWTSFPVKTDGTLGSSEEFFNVTDRVGKEPGLPDGMTVDCHGNLWATGPGGVYVFSPEAKLLGRIVTGERTSNCTFGPSGELFITADSYLCRIQTKTARIEIKNLGN